MVGINSINNVATSQNANNLAFNGTMQEKITEVKNDRFEKSKPTREKREKSQLEKILNKVSLIAFIGLCTYSVGMRIKLAQNVKKISSKLESPTKEELNKIFKSYHSESKLKITKELIKQDNLEKTKPEEITNIINKIIQDKKIPDKKNDGFLNEILDIFVVSPPYF